MPNLYKGNILPEFENNRMRKNKDVEDTVYYCIIDFHPLLFCFRRSTTAKCKK